MLQPGRYRHRLLGYTVTAHARPSGLLLIDEAGNHLRNWTVRHEDAEWFAATWEAIRIDAARALTLDELVAQAQDLDMGY